MQEKEDSLVPGGREVKGGARGARAAPTPFSEGLKPLEAGQQIPTPEGRGEASESGGRK